MSLLEYNIMKARHGRYADTAENRRLHRVGQEYGHAAQEEQGSSQKPSQKGEEAKEKRTYDTARKELSAVLSHKDEFISKYGEDEYNKRVGALVAEAKTLRDTEHTAEADKDFDKLKQPEKPQDTRSKKEKRTERLEKYKEQLKKVQEKMNEEGASEESRKMGEALEAKWKAKIEKLEAKVNRGSKKNEEAEPETEPAKTKPEEKKEFPSEKNRKKFDVNTDKDVKAAKSYKPEEVDTALSSLKERMSDFSEKDLLNLEREIGHYGAYMVSGGFGDLNNPKYELGNKLIRFANEVRDEIRKRRKEKAARR